MGGANIHAVIIFEISAEMLADAADATTEFKDVPAPVDVNPIALKCLPQADRAVKASLVKSLGELGRDIIGPVRGIGNHRVVWVFLAIARPELLQMLQDLRICCSRSFGANSAAILPAPDCRAAIFDLYRLIFLRGDKTLYQLPDRRSVRACRQLSQMIAAARWMAARKFCAVLS